MAAALTNWGRWGPDDQIGTANFVTPEVVLGAVSLVRQGQVLSLAVPLDPRTPTDPSRPPMQHFGKNVLLRVSDHGWPLGVHVRGPAPPAQRRHRLADQPAGDPVTG
jgi:hypothetical protein